MSKVIEPGVVNVACYCSRCTGRTEEFYRLGATCLNCGGEFVVEIRKGDNHPHNAACPFCGVERTSWGRLVSAPDTRYAEEGESAS